MTLLSDAEARQIGPRAYRRGTMPDLHFEHPRLAAIYDTESGWSADRGFYLALPGLSPERILDLGCGTGLLATAYAARGHAVTGVDPAPAMLAVARAWPHGDRVEWVEATAQTYPSSTRFDLVIMTGHAFQVLLTAEDVRAACLTMREHLAPAGRVVFETRNPAVDWQAIWDGWEERREADGVAVAVSYRCAPIVGQRLRFETHYAFPDERLVSTSELLFLSREEIEAHLSAVGLQMESVQGEWDGSPFDPERSHEMIFTARHDGR